MGHSELASCIKELKMPSVLEYFAEVSERAGKENWSFERYLYELLTIEREHRKERRIQKLTRESRLPLSKTLDSLDRTRFSRAINQQIDALSEGSFLSRYENVLVFGNPGSGKSHTLCAIANELILQGHRILFRNFVWSYFESFKIFLPRSGSRRTAKKRRGRNNFLGYRTCCSPCGNRSHDLSNH